MQLHSLLPYALEKRHDAASAQMHTDKTCPSVYRCSLACPPKLECGLACAPLATSADGSRPVPLALCASLPVHKRSYAGFRLAQHRAPETPFRSVALELSQIYVEGSDGRLGFSTETRI